MAASNDSSPASDDIDPDVQRSLLEQAKAAGAEGNEIRRAEREESTLMFLFGRAVETWARSEIAKLKGKRKSINLPAGCIGFRSLASRLVVDDEALVLKWARRHLPGAVVVSERLSKSVINEHAKNVGEIPDEGVHVEPASEKFFIR